MEYLIRAVVGFLILAHGLVHLLFVAPDAKDPGYAFTLESSWIIPEPARRPIALGLMAATVVAFGLLALAVWGVPGLSGAWPTIAIAASSISLVLLIAFWDWRLSFGVAVGVALIAIAVIRPEFTGHIAG